MMGDTVEALGRRLCPLPMRSFIRLWSQGPSTGAENPPVSYYYNKFYKVALL